MHEGRLRFLTIASHAVRAARASTFALVCCVVACGGGASGPTAPPATPILTTVRVAVADTMLVGASATASAVGLDQNSLPIQIATPAWSTTEPSIATVSASGVLSALAPGVVTLVASVNDKQGLRVVTVVQAPVARLVLTPDAPRLARGRTLQLNAGAVDYEGRGLAGRRVDWTSLDPSLATVTSAGVVTALAPGVVTIGATCENVRASTVLTITLSSDSVASITVSPTSATLTVGDTLQLAAALMDASGGALTGRTVTWSVSGTSGGEAVSVSSSGRVIALAPGSVIVEAFSEGKYAAATLVVLDNLDSAIVISFASPADSEVVGDTLRVLAGVKSAHPLVSVVATVGPFQKTVPMKFTPVGALGGSALWNALVDVTDLPTGPYKVLVTATDDRGRRGAGTIQFTRDTRAGKGGSGEIPKMK
jgi:uncharacterized protein YjdB